MTQSVRTASARPAAANTADGPTAVTPAPVLPRSPWLRSGSVDLGIVYGGGALIAVAFFLASHTGAGLVVGAAIFGMVLDMPHVLSTSVRVLGDRDEFAIHGRRYLVSAAVAVGAVTAADLLDALEQAVIVWAVWQFFHVVKQHMGMAIIYAGKARYGGSRRPLKLVIASAAVAPLLVRARHGLHFGHYEINGNLLPFSDLTVPFPHPPLAVIALAYAVAIGAAVALLVDTRRAARAGKPLPGHVWLGVAFVIVSYNLAYLAVDDLLALIIIATASHSLQYHLINWRRLAGTPPVESPAEGGVNAFIERHPVATFAVAIFVLGALASALETTALFVVSIGLVLQHFYMDRYLWRANLNPRLAGQLGLK